MSAKLRESSLFLQPLDAFTFDFAPSQPVAEDVPTDAHTDHSDGSESEIEDRTQVTVVPSTSHAPLSADEVSQLFDDALSVGSRFFSLPQNAPTLELATAQYVQVLQRQAAQLKMDAKEKTKHRDAKKKRSRE